MLRQGAQHNLLAQNPILSRHYALPDHAPCLDIRERDVPHCRLLACFLGKNPMIDLITISRSVLSGPCTLNSQPSTSLYPKLRPFFFFFFTLVTGLGRSLSLKLSDTRVYEPHIRARLGSTAHFCKVVVLKLRALN